MRYRDNVWLQAFIAIVIFVMCIAGCSTFCGCSHLSDVNLPDLGDVIEAQAATEKRLEAHREDGQNAN